VARSGPLGRGVAAGPRVRCGSGSCARGESGFGSGSHSREDGQDNMSDWVSVDLGNSGIVSGQPEHVVRSVATWRSRQEEERDWIAGLCAQGIKAAHPDDGWVDREKNRVHLEYPQFGSSRSLQIGDLLALGWPDRTRIVRVTGFSENPFAIGLSRARWYVHFEDAEAR
jgi:hypothetical protein